MIVSGKSSVTYGHAMANRSSARELQELELDSAVHHGDGETGSYSVAAMANIRGRALREALIEQELAVNNPCSVEALRSDAERYERLLQTADLRDAAAAREAHSLLTAQGLPPSSPEYAERFRAAKRSRTHFPVLMLSAPHIDQALAAHFPGEPTPLLYAIAPALQLSRLELFPSRRIPDIHLLHAHVFDEAFRTTLLDLLAQEQPWAVGISNMAEGHHNALEIARIIKRHAPHTVVILGGSHEDGTNPQGFERDALALGQPLTDEQRVRLARLRTLGIEADRQNVDFVVCGDGPYMLLAWLAIIGDHERPSPDEVKRAVLARADELRRVQGSGELFFFDRETQEIRGVSFRGDPISREELPFIDRQFSKSNRYACFQGEPTAQVMWNDGCVEVCTYCHEAKEHLLYGVKKVRQRTPENVVAEIERIVRLHGVSKIFFDDSTFTQLLTPTRRLLDLLIERRPLLGSEFEWGCQTTITRLDPVLVKKMADAGCSYVYFGLEGAAPDPAMMTKVRKTAREGREPSQAKRALPVVEPQSAQDSSWFQRFQEVVAWCEQAHVRVGVSLQFGLGERDEDVARMFDCLHAMHRRGTIPDHCVALNMNAIYPGTEQYRQEVILGGRDIDYRRQLTRHPGFETQHDNCPQPREQAERIYRQARLILRRALVGHE